MRVLVADDEPWIRKGLMTALKELLSALSPEFVEAEDGQEAWEKARDALPDLVIVDIHMPRLKGLDLVERLNTLAGLGPIIVITGHDEFEYAHRALQLRVFDFLLKPVPDEALREVMQRALAHREKTRHVQDWTGWTKKQLEAQQKTIFTGDLERWLEGRETLAQLRVSAAYLELSWAESPEVALFWFSGPGAESEQAALRTAAEAAFPQGWCFPYLREFLVLLVPGGETPELAQKLRILGEKFPLEFLLVDSAASLTWDEIPQVLGEWTAAAQRGDLGLASAARAYLERHFSEPELTLETAAAHLRVSSNHLSRLLKQAVGQSFAPFVAQLRLNQAQKLLLDPRLRVSEIALRVGYRDQNYFARQFRAQVGVSPLEWRRSRGKPS